MTYQVPQDIYAVNAALEYNESLKPDDERYVHTEKARGDFSFNSVFKALGVSPSDLRLVKAPPRKYNLFCGHRGCGKSTELRRLAVQLHDPQRFFVIFLDILKELDPNNLHYVDVMMGLAKALFDDFKEYSIAIDPVFLTNLENWFSETVRVAGKSSALSSEIQTGIQGKSGIPLLCEFAAKFTTAFKINATYKEELRTVIKNSYSVFASAFNLLIQGAEEALRKAGKGQRLLFVVDGTDRLSSADSENFFVKDVYQLQQVEGLFVYCAPIHLLGESNQVQQAFAFHKLPMIKLHERDTPNIHFEPGYEALRKLVYQRAAASLFDSPETVDYLICHSGGCPRELLHLLEYAYQASETDRFDRAAAESAVKRLATDYRYWLKPGDFELLARIDRNEIDGENDARAQELLYNLALLEYNSFWRRSHPVVRLLEPYRLHNPV